MMTRSQQGRTHRLTRPSIAIAAAVAVTAGVVAAAPDAKTAEPTPKLGLVAASTSVTLDSWKEDPGVYLDLGTYLTSENGAFELKVTRKSYKDPVVAQQILRNGKKTTTKALPAGLVKDFSGLPDFAKIAITDAAGKTVLSKTEAFCPNNASGRIRPDAPANSKYPQSCPVNPFTLGSVWGVENGWASNTYAGYYSDPVQLAAGTYTAKISVTKKYRDLFGIANKPQTVKVVVRERSWEDEGEGGGEGLAAEPRSAAPKPGASAASASGHEGHGGHSGHAGHGQVAETPAAPSAHAGHGAPARPEAPATRTTGAAPTFNVGHGPYPPAPPALPWALKKESLQRQAFSAAKVGDRAGQTDGSRQAPGATPNAKRPTGKATVPDVPKPDLRSLPAYGITVSDGYEDVPGKDYLAFSANVWNAGPAKLVVDGFRSPGKELMDAYQYFYDADGKQVGYTPTGTMEWDPRPGHEHWHFTDFASYRLLKADKKETVRSGKEAFCLANTDAVDYTVKNANWHPDNTDLSTACGQENSISVREVLDVGSGDTYTQDLPGQSFDITDLPNGTYYIQVLANPENRLKETNHNNNSALRKVVLGGKKGARTVKVPAHHLVSAN
ncbi:lysyl oxidase family protein [Streptomyces sp. ATCC51928]|uniref:Lysyl oxidase family protein n=1 Tax=Streptomyces caviscabies TaxID=90079 RepID=A0ABW2MI69_9ACTN|nr:MULTISPECIES: lysyl oxidase family protein [unclassified Streptomyces]MDX3507298.1 lysyl oxidase family protein [Streptomyces sp. ATCC51928]MDX5520349.1 lysyl oxidase family protein [Streptomyces sp. DE06-01C]